MTQADWAAVLSTVSAMVIVLASFRQWWDVNYNGGMPLRIWAKIMLGSVFIALGVSLFLLLTGVPSKD